MNTDTFLQIWDLRPEDVLFQSHDWMCVEYAQSWRILEGAEPSLWLSVGEPAVHMRYGPYR